MLVEADRQGGGSAARSLDHHGQSGPSPALPHDVGGEAPHRRRGLGGRRRNARHLGKSHRGYRAARARFRVQHDLVNLRGSEGSRSGSLPPRRGPGVAERAAEAFRATYAGLKVAGTTCPAEGFEHDEQEMARIHHEVAEANAQIVFVALGFPKQDLLIRALRRSLPNASFLGVGISLSYATGDLSRPPSWICGLGLEWAYRLWQEPTRRLARRYLIDGLPFAGRLIANAFWHRLTSTRSTGQWGLELRATAQDTPECGTPV